MLFTSIPLSSWYIIPLLIEVVAPKFRAFPLLQIQSKNCCPPEVSIDGPCTRLTYQEVCVREGDAKPELKLGWPRFWMGLGFGVLDGFLSVIRCYFHLMGDRLELLSMTYILAKTWTSHTQLCRLLQITLLGGYYFIFTFPSPNVTSVCIGT